MLTHLLYISYTQEEIRAFGLSDADIFGCKVTDKYKAFMQFQISRARDYYRIAEEGVHMLDPRYCMKYLRTVDTYDYLCLVCIYVCVWLC